MQLHTKTKVVDRPGECDVTSNDVPWRAKGSRCTLLIAPSPATEKEPWEWPRRRYNFVDGGETGVAWREIFKMIRD